MPVKGNFIGSIIEKVGYIIIIVGLIAGIAIGQSRYEFNWSDLT